MRKRNGKRQIVRESKSKRLLDRERRSISVDINNNELKFVTKSG